MFKFGGGSSSEEEAKTEKKPEVRGESDFFKKGNQPKTNVFGLSMMDLNADFIVPETFEKLRNLGKGAYGKVMEVLHIETQQKFAVKRFDDVFSKELRARRLLREMVILKSVKHPCLNKLKAVIPPLDYNNFNEAYLVIDPCEMDLKKLLKSSKHLEETQVKSMIYDMVCGLLYLHKAQIIHRDLKPANILVNNDCTIQICDFGLARSMKGVYESKP